MTLPLVNWLLMGFSFIGCIGFIIAFVYSIKNHHLTQFASSVWFIFCVTMAFGALWAFSASLSYWNLVPEVFQAVEHIFLACFASLFFAVTYTCYSGQIKLM